MDDILVLNSQIESHQDSALGEGQLQVRNISACIACRHRGPSTISH